MSLTVSAGETWRLGIPGQLPLHCWDGDYVVYNPLSGNTHILDIVTGEVLQTIMAGEVGISEICQHVAHFLEVPNDNSIAEHVKRILATLDRLALIEPDNGC